MLCGLFYEAICFKCCLVLFCSCPFSIAITSLGEERANLSVFRMVVWFTLVWFCLFPLPLCVWDGCGLWLWHALILTIPFWSLNGVKKREGLGTIILLHLYKHIWHILFHKALLMTTNKICNRGRILEMFNWIQFISEAMNYIRYSGRPTRKHVYKHMRTAKAQISLRIRAVWSGPTLSAVRVTGYYIMYPWRANAPMRPCACVQWSESVHFAHARRHYFAWRSPFSQWF